MGGQQGSQRRHGVPSCTTAFRVPRGKRSEKAARLSDDWKRVAETDGLVRDRDDECATAVLMPDGRRRCAERFGDGPVFYTVRSAAQGDRRYSFCVSRCTRTIRRVNVTRFFSLLFSDFFFVRNSRNATVPPRRRRSKGESLTILAGEIG